MATSETVSVLRRPVNKYRKVDPVKTLFQSFHSSWPRSPKRFTIHTAASAMAMPDTMVAMSTRR